MFIPLYIPGHWELIIVVIAVIILFGGKKIRQSHDLSAHRFHPSHERGHESC